MPFGVGLKSSPVTGPLSSSTRTFWNDAATRELYWHFFVLMLGSYVCGFDGSVMSGFFGIPLFLEDLGQPDANFQGLLSGAVSLGYIIGFIPAAWSGDLWGRKWPQVFGSVVVVAGTFMGAFAISGWKYFGARIIIGFGAAFPLTLGSAHIFELAKSRNGATLASCFAAFYWVGAIVAAWSTYGTVNIASNWSWRIPTLLQALASVIQAVAIPFVPESPRYLVANGRDEEAHQILAKYHGGGDAQDAEVLASLAEIKTALELEQASSAFGYLDFFRGAANRKRLFICVFVGVIVQWMGNGIISYYLIPILSSVGISTVAQQQGINGGLQIWNLAVSVFTCIYVQQISRRALWLGSTIGCLLTYAMFTACSGVFDHTGGKASGNGAVALIFLYQAAYDVAFSVLYYSYVLEVLPYRMRTKGMAVCLFVDYAALFFNQYVNPIGFNGLGYRYYFVYIGVIVLTFFVIYFGFPETAGLTLEQSSALLDGDIDLVVKDGLKAAGISTKEQMVEEDC